MLGRIQPRLAAVHQHQRRLVVGHVGVHRADDAMSSMLSADVGEQLADLDAALAVLLELERRAEGRAGLAFGVFNSSLVITCDGPPLQKCG